MSFQVDSRDQPVELDYPLLQIDGTTTFKGIVDFDNSLTPKTFYGTIIFNGNTIHNAPAIFNDTITANAFSEFNQAVQFNNFVTGYTWPRMTQITGASYNYVAPNTITLPLTTQTVNLDEFTTAPTLSHTNYFTVNNNGTITVTSNHTMHIEVSLSATFNTANSDFLFQLTYIPITAPPAITAAECQIQPTIVPFATTGKLDTTQVVSNGDTFSVTMVGSANITITLSYKISILK